MGKARHGSRTARLAALLAVSTFLLGGPSGIAREHAAAQPAEIAPQTVLPPGLYLFQTRTREGTCNDAPRTCLVHWTFNEGEKSMQRKAVRSR